MSPEQLTVEWDDVVCTVTLMTADEYYKIDPQTLPLFENCFHEMVVAGSLRQEAPHFNHPRLYAALKSLFGESTTMYDDYKASFGYPFLLKINKKGTNSQYTMMFTDRKGNITFQFQKVLTSEAELRGYPDRRQLQKPFQEEFSETDMQFLMNWFTFYLVGFMESFERYYNEEFCRSLYSCSAIYGYRNGEFFVQDYNNQEDYYTARRARAHSGEIPFNRVKPNPPHGE